MSPAARRWITLAILTFATVTVSHDLLYLLAHGPGEGYGQAMAASGHASYWAGLVASAAVLAAGLAGTTAWQLRRLTRMAARARPDASDDAASVGAFVRLAFRWWRSLLIASAAWFLLQENLERLASGGTLPLVGALAGDQLAALPILAVVSFAIALVTALVAWRRCVLLARLARSRPWPRRVATAPSIALNVLPRRPDPSAGRRLRAPPLRSQLI